MRKLILIISVVLFSATVFSQDHKKDFKGIKMNALSLNLLGTTPVAGLTYERIVSQYMSLEIGVGSNSFGVGTKIMPFKIKESMMMFTSGLSIVYADYKNGFLASGKRTQLYVPIGVSYYGTKGFNFGIDAGPAYRAFAKDANSNGDANGFIPWAGIKMGMRF
jgi:hypothetical protein